MEFHLLNFLMNQKKTHIRIVKGALTKMSIVMKDPPRSNNPKARKVTKKEARM